MYLLSRKNRERKQKMFQLTAEKFAALLKTDLETMKEKTKKNGVGVKRLAEASKVKRDYSFEACGFFIFLFHYFRL